MARKPGYTISELAESAGTTPRTVRYYTAEGLLPPPDARGRFALYSDEHLDRLRLIGRLKETYIPLNAIREQLARLTHTQIRELLAGAAKLPRQESLEELLGELYGIRQMPHPPIRTRESRIDAGPDLAGSSEWYRFEIAPGLELHAQAPIGQQARLKIDQLIAAGRQMFSSQHEEADSA